MTAPLLISLGARCDVAWQIHNHFGAQPAFPFDWLVTPLQSIPLMIDENFTDIANERYLAPSTYIHPFNGRELGTIINTKYHVFLHHEFDRTADGQIVDDWQSKIEDAQSKYRFLSTRWRDTLQSRKDILFVRRRGCLDMPREADIATLQTHFESALESLRAIAPGCRMLAVDPNCEIHSEDILSYRVGQPTFSDWYDEGDYWKGATSAWRTLFDELVTTAG